MMFHGLIRETEGLRWIRWLIIENGNLGNQIRLSVDRPEPFPSTIMHFPYIMSCSASPLYLKVTGVSPRHIVQWFCFSQEGFSMIWKLQKFSKKGFPNGIIQRSNLQHHFIAKQESSGATIWKTIFPGIGHSLGVNSEYPPGGWTIVPNCTTCSTLHYLIAWYFMLLRILKNTEKYWL